MKFCSLLFAGLLFNTLCFAGDFNILNFGAKSDGTTVNTKSIQQAIDSCTASGGGDVLIPAGNFISGTIFLKSNVNLYLQAGAILKGSDNIADYKVAGHLYGLIYGIDLENVSITGQGEINGNGIHFMHADQRTMFVDYDPKLTRQGDQFMHNYTGIGDGPLEPNNRPDMLIIIMHASRVRLDGITITDAPNWTIRIGECEDVTISKLIILNNQLIPNNDGIHCTTSRNVTISDCKIIAGDDGIIVTGFGDETSTGGYTEPNPNRQYRYGNKTHEAKNISVSNCIISSISAGIRIGYGMANISTCSFSNLIIYDSNRGILIQCRDSNTISNLKFSHILIDTRLFAGAWWGKAEPIHISTLAQKGTTTVGKIHDISFEDVVVKHAEAGIVLFGIDAKSSVDNIRFENISLTIGGGKQSGTFGGNIDLRPSASYQTALYKRDLPAFYGHNTNNITLNNISVNWESGTPDYFKAALEFENFTGLKIRDFSGKQAGVSGPVILLNNGDHAQISDSKAAAGSDIFCKAIQCKNLKFSTDNDTQLAKQKLLVQ